MVAVIGGEPRQFAPLVDLYRRAGAQAGHSPDKLQVGLHVFGFVAESVQAAADTIYPGWEEMFTQVSRERGFPRPTRQQFDATSGPDGAFFMGDPQTVADKIRRVSEQLGGVDRLSLSDDQPPSGPRRPAPRHRAARHRGCAAGGRRLAPARAEAAANRETVRQTTSGRADHGRHRALVMTASGQSHGRLRAFPWLLS